VNRIANISGDCPPLPIDGVAADLEALCNQRISRETVPLPDDRVVALCCALYPRGQGGRRPNLNLVRLSPLLPDDGDAAALKALCNRRISWETVPLPDDRVVALRRALYPGGQGGGRRY
jgi:hypothetical protein